MRTLLKVTMDTQATNPHIQDGSLSRLIRSLVDEIRPEASYFFADRGKRTGLFVFDMKDSSQIPVIVEDLFTQLNAEIELQPVMNQEEVSRGLESWAGTRKKAA